MFSTNESVERQITDPISENLTDLDLESGIPRFWIHNSLFKSFPFRRFIIFIL